MNPEGWENESERIVISLEDLDPSIPVEDNVLPPPGYVQSATYDAASLLSGRPAEHPDDRPPALGAQPTPTTIRIDQPIGYGAAGHGNQGYGRAPQGSSFLSTIGANSIVSGLVAGGLGGFVGALFAEPVIHSGWQPTTAVGVQFFTGVWLAIYAAVLGFALSSWEGLTSQSPAKGFRDGSIGAALGACAGLLGGFVAQWVYSQLVPDVFSYSEPKALLARTVGWAVFGVLVGLGVCLNGGKKRMLNGLIGGFGGGAVAGFLFELIGHSGIVSSITGDRLICMTITGVGIGLGVGLVERVRRDCWLRIVSGPMSGKEFILYNQLTRVGRDYRCEIVLTKDIAVAPVHAMFGLTPAGQVTVQAEPGAVIAVNGAPTTGAQLRSGDLVGVGSTTIALEQRISSPVGPPAGPW